MVTAPMQTCRPRSISGREYRVTGTCPDPGMDTSGVGSVGWQVEIQESEALGHPIENIVAKEMMMFHRS